MPRQARGRPALHVGLLLPLFAALLLAGCEGCFGQDPDDDAGPDASVPGDDAGTPPSDAGPLPDGGAAPDGGEALCSEDTPGFGEECGECGLFLCNVQTDQLECLDPGLNDCGSCGELDLSAGRAGDPCGEFGCGFAQCNAEGTATECIGDRERNACGGCSVLVPDDVGASCSACETGVKTCTRDMESLVCWRGRSPSNSCGGCEPCVQYHAYMDERLGGGYLKSGTLAIFEDIGSGQRQLVFDPLVEGPGANALVLAHLILSPEPVAEVHALPGGAGCFSEFDCPADFDCVTQVGQCVKGSWLNTAFAAQIAPLNMGADPVRSFSTLGVNVGDYPYLLLYDWFLGEVISVGELVPGAPAGYIFDAGPAPDAGPSDAGTSDAGWADGGVFDAGLEDDAGLEGDGGPLGDAGHVDAGPDDAGDAAVD